MRKVEGRDLDLVRAKNQQKSDQVEGKAPGADELGAREIPERSEDAIDCSGREPPIACAESGTVGEGEQEAQREKEEESGEAKAKEHERAPEHHEDRRGSH